MPCDYSKSKIYALKSAQTDEIYIGSTSRPLYQRFGEHKQDIKLVKAGKKMYKKTTAMKITQYPDVYIELVEEFPCSSKEELHRRELEVIQRFSCVNKANPIDGRIFA
jgi:hypothetical protein